MKLTKITIIIACITIIIVCIALPRINQIKSENIELRNYIKQLEVNINIKDIQVKDLQDEVTGLNQELENTKINYYSTMLVNKELKRRYIITSSYAEVAESLLLANDINFRQVD